MTLRPNQISVSTASFAQYDLDAAIEAVRRTSPGGIELLAFEHARHSVGDLAGVWAHQLSRADRSRLRAKLAGFAHVAVHAPFFEHHMFACDARVAQLGRQAVVEAIALCADLGGTAVAVHLNHTVARSVDDMWPDWVTGLRWLGDQAAQHRVWVGVETGIPGHDDMPALLQAVDHPWVGCTVDTGHLIGSVDRSGLGTPVARDRYNRALQELVSRLGPKAVHFHVHDVRADDWRDHREVGTGIIDWPGLARALDQIAYAGALAVELEEPDRPGAIHRSVTHLANCIGATG